MHSRAFDARWAFHSLSLTAAVAVALACAGQAKAQSFAANYDLLRLQDAAGEGVPHAIHLAPTVFSEGDVAGAGLSLQAGTNWVGQVGLGHAPPLGWRASGSDVLTVAGGYRWADGQLLSLQVSRGRGPDRRLGLAVSYDWPKYFLKFSWDSRVNFTPQPQETMKFSAGMRF